MKVKGSGFIKQDKKNLALAFDMIDMGPLASTLV